MISLERRVPGQNLDKPLTWWHTSTLRFSLLSSAIAINSMTRSNYTKSSALGMSLMGTCMTRIRLSKCSLTHVCLDRRHGVRDTKALEISGCMGSKEIRGV